MNEVLAEEVRQQVEVFEDRFVTYQFARKQFRENQAAAPSRPEVLEELAAIQHKLLLAIKTHQTILSHVPRGGCRLAFLRRAGLGSKADAGVQQQRGSES